MSQIMRFQWTNFTQKGGKGTEMININIIGKETLFGLYEEGIVFQCTSGFL